jgi:hypothetical protein
LNQILDLHLTNPLSKTIFLNADILPGPGRRWMKHVDPAPFIETSLSHIRGDQVEFDFLFVTAVSMMFQNRFSNFCFRSPSIISYAHKTNQDGGLNYALSLGYRANFRSFRGYTKDDIERMTELVRHYKLDEKVQGKTTSTLDYRNETSQCPLTINPFQD